MEEVRVILSRGSDRSFRAAVFLRLAGKNVALLHNKTGGSGVYHHLWMAVQDDPELTAVVRSRQLHIYCNGKKILVLAGKAATKIIREDHLTKHL